MKHIFRRFTAVVITPAVVSCSGIMAATPQTAGAAAKAVSIQHAPAHDPSVVYCEEDKNYYIFGSHQTAYRSKDLISWKSTGAQIYKKTAEKELAATT